MLNSIPDAENLKPENYARIMNELTVERMQLEKKLEEMLTTEQKGDWKTANNLPHILEEMSLTDSDASMDTLVGALGSQGLGERGGEVKDAEGNRRSGRLFGR